jgi:ATP phosphoribosyltransferase
MLFFRGLPVITLALSKGRIYDQTVPLLKAAGVMARGDPETSRKLILATARISALPARTRSTSMAARACISRSISRSRAAAW